MTEIPREAVAQVDGGVGDATQRDAKRQPGLRPLHRAAQGRDGVIAQLHLATKHLERQPRVADAAASSPTLDDQVDVGLSSTRRYIANATTAVLSCLVRLQIDRSMTDRRAAS